jgi:hypothetical protein
MKATKSRYNGAMFLLAAAVWIYTLSWVLTPSVWLPVINARRHLNLTTDGMMAVLGSSLIVLAVLTGAAVAFHALVIAIPCLRARFQPRFVSHIAAFALFWIAFGAVTRICSAHFPYFRLGATTDSRR